MKTFRNLVVYAFLFTSAVVAYKSFKELKKQSHSMINSVKFDLNYSLPSSE